MLALRDKGTGPVLLLLHGAPSPAQELFELALPFADRRRIIVPDFPGYGQSPMLSGEPSLLGMQESVETELLKRGIEEVAVVGVSMGGYRALHMALSSRVRVSHVVTLGGFAHYGEEEVAALLGFADMLQPLADFSSADIRAIAPPRFLSPTYLEQHPEAAALVQSWLDVTTPSALAAELRTVAHFPNLLSELSALNVPVTAIVGEKDAATPVALSEEIANACPQGKLVVAPGHGHALTIEAMDELRRAVANAVGLGGASAWEA